MFPYRSRIGGRRTYPPEFLDEIREFVMTDEWTKILPGKSGVENARCLTHDISKVYAAFPRNAELSYNRFRQLLSGKKNSATPALRAWLNETDRCDKCPKRKEAIKQMTIVIKQSSLGEGAKEKYRDIFNNIVHTTETSMVPDLGRETMLELDQLIVELATHSRVTLQKIVNLMNTICTIGFHVYTKNLVWAEWNELRTREITRDEILIAYDFKAKVERGAGPVEDCYNIHQRQQTNVFGAFIRYLDPTWGKTASMYFLVCTDVLDTTAVAAIAFIWAELTKIV